MTRIVGVILAGGKGTRMGALTDSIPKPMLSICGMPLLEHHIQLCKRHGILDIIISVSHLSDQIQSWAMDGSTWGVNITYFNETKPLGTAGAFPAMKLDPYDHALIIYGDVYMNINFERLIQFHTDHQAMATLCAHPNDHPYDSDLIETNEHHQITAFHSKPHLDGINYRNLVNAGCYVIQTSLLSDIVPDKPSDFGKDIFPFLD